jgi:hypothetical protein
MGRPGQPTSPDPGDVEGVPSRIKKPYTIIVYKNFGKAEEPDYKPVFKTWQRLPDQERMFTANFDSGYFADENLTLTINPDSTLQNVDLKTSIKADEALAGLAGQASALNTKVREGSSRPLAPVDRARADLAQITDNQSFFDQFKKPEQTEEERQEEIAKEEAAIQSAYEAMLAVNLAEARYEEALEQEEIAESERIKLLNELRLAQFKANAAYRAADLPEPFPGLFP